MASLVSQLLSVVESQRRQLNKLDVAQLNSSTKREELRQLVENYFNVLRPQIEPSAEPEQLQNIDSNMQSLLTYCHKRGSVAKYVEYLTHLKSDLIKLDSHLVAGVGRAGNRGQRDSVDEKILLTLRGIVPSAADSYEQALTDLASSDRLSWRGPATDLREALRETLDQLAPDKDVEDVPGYKAAPGAHRPTMKQKVSYILKNRGVSKTLTEPAQNAVDAVDDIIGKLVRSVYNRSSVSTHTPTDRNEVVRIYDFVRVVLCELLEIRR
jgi:hypothetical protein